MPELQSVPENPDSPFSALPRKLFWVFCSVHLLVWTLFPSLTYQSVPADTLEGISWGNMWLLGYDKHPPLAPWLSALFTDVFGSVGWPVFFASQLAVILCFWAVWKLAREMLDPWRALLAVSLLEGIYYYNAESLTFNPNIVMLATWAMLTMTFYGALRHAGSVRWAQVGLWAGLAILAKYESAVLFIVLAGLLVGTREGRRSFSSSGLYVGLAVAVAVITPHLVWLSRHDFVAFGYALNSAQHDVVEAVVAEREYRWSSSLIFLGEQLGALLPAFLLFLLFGRPRLKIDWRNFDHVFITFLTLGPLLVSLFIIVVLRMAPVARWAFPFFSTLGIALLLFCPPRVDRIRLRRFFAGLLILYVVLLGGFTWIIYGKPRKTGHAPSSIMFPTKPLADYVTRRWHEYYDTPLAYVAGDRWRVAGITAYSADKPKPYFDWKPRENFWLDEDALRRSGAVFVHQIKGDDEALIQVVRARFPALINEEIVDMPYLSSIPAAPERFWLAYLPPAKVQGASGASAR